MVLTLLFALRASICALQKVVKKKKKSSYISSGLPFPYLENLLEGEKTNWLNIKVIIWLTKLMYSATKRKVSQSLIKKKGPNADFVFYDNA